MSTFKLKSARLTDDSTGDLVDNALGALEVELGKALGVSLDTDNTAPAVATASHLHDDNYSSKSHVHTAGDGGELSYGDIGGTPELGNSSALDVGVGAGTVAAGDDSRFASQTAHEVFSDAQDGFVPAADGEGETLKFLKGDGSWATPSTGDIPTGSGYTKVLSGSWVAAGVAPIPVADLAAAETAPTTKYLRGDCSWQTLTAAAVFDATHDGLAPMSGTPAGKYLKDNGTWATLTNATLPTGTGVAHMISGVPESAATLVVNADVHASAAISASKIDFGAGANHAAVTLASSAQELLSLSTQALSFATKAKNLVLASHATTDTQVPTFRSLVTADIPAIEVSAPSAYSIPKSGSAGKLDISWLPTGTGATTVCIGNDNRLSNVRTPDSHELVGATPVHTVSGLTTGNVLQALSATTFGFGAIPAHTHAGYATTAHKATHYWNGSDALAASDIGAADQNHSHTYLPTSDEKAAMASSYPDAPSASNKFITQSAANTALSSYLTISSAAATYAPIAKGVTGGDSHTHAYSALTGKPTLGTAAAANLGTGAADASYGNHAHSGVYLAAAGVAADSSKLNGQSASYYAKTVGTACASVATNYTGSEQVDLSKLGTLGGVVNTIKNALITAGILTAA